MANEILNAIKAICSEKNISIESVVETIEAALAAAFRKDFGQKNQNIKVKYDLETGQYKVYDVKTVVEKGPEEEEEDEPEKEEKREKKEKREEKGEEDEEKEKKFNPKTDITLEDAKKIKKSAKIDDEIKTKLDVPEAFGRMAAQTAKQVIIQKLREAERDSLYDEYKEKENEILVGVVQRREGRLVLVDLGRLTAIMPLEEQIEEERYSPGEKIKVFVVSVEKTTKGPEIVVSRSRPEIVKQLFVLEIPEIASEAIEIKAVAREAGSRTKIAVESKQEGIDPIGSCVGQRGSRVQTIINELSGEKIDIIEYNEDPAKFIANALSPAQIANIETDEKERTATVAVKEDQLSLAIGKAGQNVRLAAKLTGWKINITEEKGVDEDKVEDAEKVEEEQKGEKSASAEASSSAKASDDKTVDKKEKKIKEKEVEEKPKKKSTSTEVTADKEKKKSKEKKTKEKEVEEKPEKKSASAEASSSTKASDDKTADKKEKEEKTEKEEKKEK